MHEVISKDIKDKVSLKWPNDILIGDRKVAGLLAQQIGDGVIIGIGLTGWRLLRCNPWSKGGIDYLSESSREQGLIRGDI